MNIINESAAPANEADTKITTIYTPDCSTDDTFSQALSPGKSLNQIECEIRNHMRSNGIEFGGPIRFNVEKVQRFSCDNKKNQPDEWYIAKQWTYKDRLYSKCFYGSWSASKGGEFEYESWNEENENFLKEDLEYFRKISKNLEKEHRKAEEEKRKEAVAEAAAIWAAASSEPTVPAHTAYIERKGIRVPTCVRYGKYYDYDALIIPIWDENMAFVSLQFIYESGGKIFKKFLSGGKKSGCFSIIGDLASTAKAYIVEGFSTGCSVHEATGSPVVVALGCGNLLAAAKSVRTIHPNIKFIIAADNDTDKEGNPGLTKAQGAAKFNACEMIFPSFPDDTKPGSDFNDIHSLYGLDEVNKQIAEQEELFEDNPESLGISDLEKGFRDNECGDAHLFKKLFGKDYLFDPNENNFYVWNGTSWQIDTDKTRHKKLEFVACQYENAADQLSAQTEDEVKENKKLIKSLYERAKSLKSSRRTKAVLEMATVGPVSTGGLSFNGKWDDCLGYLPCANGLVDLKTGNLLDGGRKHYIRKNSSVNYDSSAKCPLFEKFVLEIMGGNVAMAKFLKRLVGYISIGKPIEHIYVFLYGALGRNGKGTLVRMISKALGHLARSFQSELLLLQRNPPSSGSARPDLVNLDGTRFALFSEINKGRKLDSALLKNLSGGDKVVARPLYGIEREFDPTHTLLFQANHKPQAPSDDPALWSRAILVPFEVTFVENPKLDHERMIDTELENKLEQELPGILSWGVDGAVEYHTYGLQVPQKVHDAVTGYRNENDAIGNFLKEKCDLFPELSMEPSKILSVPCLELRGEIKKYCADEGLNILTNREITQALLSKGIQKHKFKSGEEWLAISLKKNEDQMN